MPNSDMKTIRILNIIACVLTALAIVGFAIGGALMVAGASYVDSDSFTSLLEEEIQGHGDGYYFDDGELGDPNYDFDDNIYYEEGTKFASAAIAVIGALLMIAAVLNLVPLIASIVGIRNASRGRKMGAVFGWDLTGAIVCFLTGRWITCVLFIVAVVKASSVKKGLAAAEAAGYAADPYAPAPEAPQFVSYGQPTQYYQQPAPQAVPQAQPVQPQYYQQPAEPAAQPVQQAQPVQPQYYQVPPEQVAQPEQPVQQAPEIQYYTSVPAYAEPEEIAPQQDEFQE